MRLSIDPRQTKIVTDGDSHAPENLFEGRLIQLTDEQNSLRAVADIGIPPEYSHAKKEAENDTALHRGRDENFVPDRKHPDVLNKESTRKAGRIGSTPRRRAVYLFNYFLEYWSNGVMAYCKWCWI